ncbi:hypothetical protein Runsl_0411 [Runella slithyformis DSM 19594]|uniref:Uncharacterized protein n=1 Tax=Runella slithyformis (strain ATCC 29530 / DSM 19594 / LMG 11500 / NCIMB 11436 / LSU 4) TaxID=761193 RepID=A0A7U3ZGL5_RUNSL|nr:hypothetical protein Runsl_0411 [Runella slithyformis DSM 19594]
MYGIKDKSEPLWVDNFRTGFRRLFLGKAIKIHSIYLQTGKTFASLRLCVIKHLFGKNHFPNPF